MARISRRQIVQDFRVRSLLEATRKIIARQGFDAVTVDRVARKAGLSKGGVYLYFPSKQHIVVAAIEEIAVRMLDAIQARVDAQAAPWPKLCQIVRAQVTIMEEHRDLLRTLLLDRRFLRDGPGGKPERLFQHRKRYEGWIRAILDEGVKRKVFRATDTTRAAFYVNELAIATAQRRMLGRSSESLEQDIDGLIRFLGLLLAIPRAGPSKSQEST